MPLNTMEAVIDHGVVNETIEDGIEEVRQVMSDLEYLGIDFEQVTTQLEHEGVRKFVEPYDAMIRHLEDKRRRFIAGH